MTSLEAGLIKIARFLKSKKIPYMVIGGIANLFWGIPRTTLDVDITIQIEEENYAALIQGLLRENYLPLVNEPMIFLKQKWVLPVEDPGGMRVDLIMARLPYEVQAIRRAKGLRVGNQRIRVCCPEDLIIHKIVSDRVKDQEDVRGIIHHLGSKLNRVFLDPMVKQLAKALARPAIWGFYKKCFKG